MHRVGTCVQVFFSPRKSKVRAFIPGQWNNSSEGKGEQCILQRLGRVSLQMNNVQLNSLRLAVAWWWQAQAQVSSTLAEWSDNWTKNGMVAVSRKKTIAATACYVVPGVQGWSADSWSIKAMGREERKNDQLLDFACLSRKYSVLLRLGFFLGHGEAKLWVSWQHEVHIWRYL